VPLSFDLAGYLCGSCETFEEQSRDLVDMIEKLQEEHKLLKVQGLQEQQTEIMQLRLRVGKSKM